MFLLYLTMHVNIFLSKALGFISRVFFPQAAMVRLVRFFHAVSIACLTSGSLYPFFVFLLPVLFQDFREQDDPSLKTQFTIKNTVWIQRLFFYGYHCDYMRNLLCANPFISFVAVTTLYAKRAKSLTLGLRKNPLHLGLCFQSSIFSFHVFSRCSEYRTSQPWIHIKCTDNISTEWSRPSWPIFQALSLSSSFCSPIAHMCVHYVG